MSDETPTPEPTPIATELARVRVTRTAVDTFWLQCLCLDCNLEMQNHGQNTETPPRYVYVCPGCGKGQANPQVFPRMHYERKGLIQAPPNRGPQNGRRR